MSFYSKKFLSKVIAIQNNHFFVNFTWLFKNVPFIISDFKQLHGCNISSSFSLHIHFYFTFSIKKVMRILQNLFLCLVAGMDCSLYPRLAGLSPSLPHTFGEFSGCLPVLQILKALQKSFFF
jgi:hypothetical protein